MTWKDGETISPLGLNRLEEAVAEMSQEYTPTVWAVGDKITAEKMNKLEQGVASISEGGGSSDFDTVEVTITGLPKSTILPLIQVGESVDLQKTIIVPFAGNDTVMAVLYQGYQYVPVDDTSTWTVTGSATIDLDLAMIVITGDCHLAFNRDI